MQNSELIYFKDKKVAVIGAGVEGISTADYLASKGAVVSLLDKKIGTEIETKRLDQVKKLRVKYCFGKDYLSSLEDFEIVFRSPGVRRDLPEIINAEKAGTQITSQIKLFFDLCSAPIVGITGTKGKGTTASLIYEILKAAGKKVFLGGNIGKPPLDFLDQVTADSLVVLELSSFQLMDLEKSPHIAVVLMITSEHLDWHKDVDEYTKAKGRIVKYQNENDFVVINKDFPSSLKLGEASRAKKYYVSTKESLERGAYIDKGFIVSVTNGWTTIAKIDEVKIPGEHNLQNIAAAVAVAGILEIPPDIISKTIISFKGLPHRLEFVREVNGVKFYSDSASTTPETAIAAVKAFKNPKIVILGGSSKQSDFGQLGRAISTNNLKAVILIGEEAKRIKEAIGVAKFSGEVIEGLKTMEEIVEKAKDLAKPGDVAILSPACASFDMFKNYLDRGEQFKATVNSLEN